MKHVVIDLEMNRIPRKSPARAICSSEIIEIGAVMLDDNLQEISSLRTYVKPEYSDDIAGDIQKLTGISYDMVAGAPGFNEALRMFTSWCHSTGDDVTIYAWSGTDYSQVRKEMELKAYEMSSDEQDLLLVEWQDFQHEFDSNLGFERAISLSMAIDMAGIEFEGRAHDALDDARNTAGLLQVFMDKTLFDSTLQKIKEAMQPTTISNSIGDLFDLSGFVLG